MTERESDTYRRGLTLGLTMAEIFILILFLLLLVLLALYAFNAETEKQLKNKNETISQLQAKVIAIKNGIDSSRSPLPENIKELVRKNVSLSNALADATEKNTIATNLLKDAKKQQGQTERKLNREEQKNDEIHEANSRLHAENTRLRAEVTSLIAKLKGIDPPCWYQVTSRNGKRHEKPYFLMDIAVYDKYLEIRAQEAPPGRAIDELGKLAATSYQEEYEKLPLPLLGTTKKVSLQQFAEITEPIKRMGKNEQIRDYACVFYVKVWDFTPETAKTRWKKAEEAIKESFYTYRIKNDHW